MSRGAFNDLAKSPIPRDKNYRDDAGQCDECGGYGCDTCDNRGWLPPGHPCIRLCARDECGVPIPPDQIAIYCCNECALEDA